MSVSCTDDKAGKNRSTRQPTRILGSGQGSNLVDVVAPAQPCPGRKPAPILKRDDAHVTSASRAIHRGTVLAQRQLSSIGDELREARLSSGASQHHVARLCGMSRQRYARIEVGRCETLSIVELHRLAAVLGLSPAVRLYPGGLPVRDVAQASRLASLLSNAQPPLRFRVEVALPRVDGRTELRAWDAMLMGRGNRTAIELESRIRDVQALLRRIALKRRDDPTEGFLLVVADTRTNRRVAQFADLLADLPRLRPGSVQAALQAGRHPATGFVLI
jgi:transcriptional regulator with XRE-family HTH domain